MKTMANSVLFFIPVLCFFVISRVDCKYVEGEIDSSSDWEFITRFCFLSAKGTLKFTFEYPVSYGPQNILLYYDSSDQWDSVYKSDKSCIAREAQLDVNKLQIVNLTTLYALSGCIIRTDTDGIDNYYCNGGRTFRSSRERWWYLAISHCYKDSTDPCGLRLQPLTQQRNIELTQTESSAGCNIVNTTGVSMYVCDAARTFRSSRERWWYIAISRCDQLTCAQRISVLSTDNNQIIFLSTSYSRSGCDIKNVNGVDKYVCSGGRTFKSARERWWYVAVSRCNADPTGNCTQREDVLNPANNQKIVLMPNSGTDSGCTEMVIDGENRYRCEEDRVFRSARERWWYIAVSHCINAPQGIKLDYKIHMTNGIVGDYLHREFSADEFYILPISLAFLAAYLILCILTIICAVFLRNRQLWHTTYKMYMFSVILWTFYLCLNSFAYGIYGNDGLEWKLRTTKYAARAFEAISIMLFLLMLILIAKGYTITRGKLSTSSTIKITVFLTLYAVTYAVIFVWEAIVFDPGLVLYLYESPPGYALIAMRIIGFLWFCYAIFFTLKHYPEKGAFYYPLFVFYTLWFWAGPIVIIIAMTTMAPWSREKTVHGVECFVSFCGHIFFLVLTRPSAANKNFPYHVRTTQIGIMQNVPHQLEGTENNGDNFTNHAYAVSSPMTSSSSGPDLTGLFTTTKTHTSEKQRETSLNNPDAMSYGLSNGLSNGTSNVIANGAPPPSYQQTPSPTPETASAPPKYDVMFRVNSQNDET